ncbi:hypothetical protein MH117_05080 [Paenibacillus sp. ACRRX]|uniref:hypothetical protein n=1 Tax=Paenibacillus sp. ACRRX TaxID=2918206 RepID=UPI001EF4B7BE|nr:hypothetical protein [Paenibacillus sp. ACRRX]MCG7406784.1 hypothetical protein [Paenibacillus sp. ACRRX]
MYEKLYLPAIENGVGAVFYWDMTYKEIIAAIQGNQRRMKSEFQIHASLVHRLGNLLGRAVNDPKNYPDISKAFPGLFEDDTSLAKNTPSEKVQSQQQDWRRMKANIEAYAAERRKRGEGNNNRGTSSPDNRGDDKLT